MSRDASGTSKSTLPCEVLSCAEISALAAKSVPLPINPCIRFSKLVAMATMSSGARISDTDSNSFDWKSPVNQFFRGHYLFHGKSSGYTFHDGVRFNSSLLSKFNSKMLRPVNLNTASNALVSLLLLFCSPTTILWRVMSIVINSVNTGSWRSWGHIVFKSGIVVFPTLANCNSPTSIVFKILGSRCITSAFHALPHGIKWRRIFEWHSGSRLKAEPIICPVIVGVY